MQSYITPVIYTCTYVLKILRRGIIDKAHSTEYESRLHSLEHENEIKWGQDKALQDPSVTITFNYFTTLHMSLRHSYRYGYRPPVNSQPLTSCASRAQGNMEQESPSQQ